MDTDCLPLFLNVRSSADWVTKILIACLVFFASFTQEVVAPFFFHLITKFNSTTLDNVINL